MVNSSAVSSDRLPYHSSPIVLRGGITHATTFRKKSLLLDDAQNKRPPSPLPLILEPVGTAHQRAWRFPKLCLPNRATTVQPYAPGRRSGHCYYLSDKGYCFPEKESELMLTIRNSGHYLCSWKAELEYLGTVPRTGSLKRVPLTIEISAWHG
jgi:hypothetical protein